MLKNHVIRKEYQPGEEVRVTEGPFADFNGTVEEVDYEKRPLKSVCIYLRSCNTS